MYPYAKTASEKLGGKIPPEAILGQWAGESGYGKSLSGRFNYAGIKATRGQPFDRQLTEEAYDPKMVQAAIANGGIFPTAKKEKFVRYLEEDSILKKTNSNTGQPMDARAKRWYANSWDIKKNQGKVWVQVESDFARYDSLEDFTNKYVDVLKNDRYKSAREASTAASFGFEVAKAGYATAAPQGYSQKVAGFVSENAELLSNLSKENAGIKRDMTGSQAPAVIVNRNNNTNTNVTRPQATPERNVNPMLGR